MNKLFVLDGVRGKGLGSALVADWESRVFAAGYRSVLTSSLASETAQHLYRRLGFLDCDALFLPGAATEILFRKVLQRYRTLGLGGDPRARALSPNLDGKAGVLPLVVRKWPELSSRGLGAPGRLGCAP